MRTKYSEKIPKIKLLSDIKKLGCETERNQAPRLLETKILFNSLIADPYVVNRYRMKKNGNGKDFIIIKKISSYVFSFKMYFISLNDYLK